MTKFEDQLYADLMQQHGRDLTDITPPAVARRPVTRRVLVAAGAGGVAVAAAVGALAATGALAGGSGATDYALTTNPDGTITLAVYQTAGIAGANAKLRALGDNVVVVPVAAGCPSITSLPAPAVTPAGPVSVGGSGSASGSITVDAHGVPNGDLMVVGVETTGQGAQVAARLTSPPAPSCVSLPASSGHLGPGSGGSVAPGGGPGGRVAHGAAGASTHSAHSSGSGKSLSSGLG